MDSSSTLHSVTPAAFGLLKKKKKKEKKRVYLQNSCGSACTSSSERSSDLQQFSITSQEARPQCVSSFSLELMAAARPEVAHQRKAVVMRIVSCRQNNFFVKRIVCSRFKCHISFWTRQQALERSNSCGVSQRKANSCVRTHVFYMRALQEKNMKVTSLLHFHWTAECRHMWMSTQWAIYETVMFCCVFVYVF